MLEGVDETVATNIYALLCKKNGLSTGEDQLNEISERWTLTKFTEGKETIETTAATTANKKVMRNKLILW